MSQLRDNDENNGPKNEHFGKFSRILTGQISKNGQI